MSSLGQGDSDRKDCAANSPVLPADATLEAVREHFKHDRFASEACGAEIIEASFGHAVCRLDIAPIHLNAVGKVMGGALFTLADFALAIASNLGCSPTVSVSNTIEFLSAAKGAQLIATAAVDKSGRSLGFYTVDVHDELGTHCARMCATCFRQP
ncbi:MAG: PaaI family thioesterase [Coriobacteriaceae bacterium]|jgi:acyl-CoA thioesterase|nr:PaaI family thioesterase [Coriobacteriaceae bacterium]